MNIDEMTIAQAKEIIRMFGAQTQITPPPVSTETNFGYAIIVLDKGFIYIGFARVEGGYVKIDSALNIRYWGTERGLGQLAIDGPTEKTKVDVSGSVFAPMHALIHVIPVAHKAAQKWANLI